MSWQKLSAIVLFAVAVYAAALPQATGQDKDKPVTKVYKAEFGKVQEGYLPDEWETDPKAPLFVTKAGGLARISTTPNLKGGMGYAVVDKSVAVLGMEFDLILDLATPFPSRVESGQLVTKAEERFELYLVGAGGKDIVLEIAPTANQAAYEVTLAGAVLKTKPEMSLKALNRFTLVIERRGEELSVTAGTANKLVKQTLVVEDKEVKSVPVPEGATTHAGLKIGFSRAGNGRLLTPDKPEYRFQLYGLQIKQPAVAPKPKK